MEILSSTIAYFEIDKVGQNQLVYGRLEEKFQSYVLHLWLEGLNLMTIIMKQTLYKAKNKKQQIPIDKKSKVGITLYDIDCL